MVHIQCSCAASVSHDEALEAPVARPTVLFGREVWAPACSLAMGPELEHMLGVQMAFFRQLCELRKNVTPESIFSPGNFVSGHGLTHGGSFLLGFRRQLYQLSLLPDDSPHLDILRVPRDNIADAKGPLLCANKAR